MPSLRFIRHRFGPWIFAAAAVAIAVALWNSRERLRDLFRKDPLPAESIEQLRLAEVFPQMPPFDKPVFITHPPDGSNRLFIVEQNGRVFWAENVPWTKRAHLALDIRDRVDQTNFYTGIFGFAFHPKAESNGRVFLHYTSAEHKGPVVSEFRMDRDLERIDAGSERKLIDFPQPFGNHDGGNLEFGPDGLLYVSIGHGGGGGDAYDDAQLKESLLGKILRIDVDRTTPGAAYGIPADNPFVGVDGAREEVWALGFRNIWRFSFDRKTGEMWATDVGHHDWEEVNIVRNGGNYGWNYYEGPTRLKDPPAGTVLEPPVLAHPYGEVSSIIGGYVYRGKRLSFLRGMYVYGDFVTGKIITARKDGQSWVPRVIARTHELATWTESPEELVKNRHITTFGEDRDGELYLATYDGKILRLQ
jgi:glucose/arabinose dehydrogenase